MTYLLLVIYVICSALGMILIKSGGQAVGLNIDKIGLGIKCSWVFILGVSLYLLSFILWTIILQKFSLTYISPISYGILFVVTAILSYFMLNETMNVTQVIGVIMIIVGVIVASMGKG